MMEVLSAADAKPKTVMIDATYLKAHRTASTLRVKKGLGRLIGGTTYRRRSGCSVIASTTPTGSGMLWKPRASSPASQVGHPATNRSYTTGAATGGAAASRSSSALEGLAPRRHSLRPMPPVFFFAVALATTVIFWL
jgi:hypothetical protein